jgi:protein-glutamine gamma-glutamyltransferase
MTRSVAAPAAPRGSAARAMATALLVGIGVTSWWWVLDGSRVGIMLVVAVAVIAVLVATRWLSVRQAAGLLAGWLAATIWAVGAPAGQLLPSARLSIVIRLVGAARQLTTDDGGPLPNHPWPLVLWLLAAGIMWFAGAVLAVSAPSSTPRRIIAFGLLAAPWSAAVAVRHSDRAAWQGAAVLLAGLLWLTGRHLTLRPALTLGVAIAVGSMAISQGIGPRTPWFTRASSSRPAPAFRTLDTELTYGPLSGRRRGATMLQITAAQPALWRMRVLPTFAGAGWRLDALPELPQPAAEPVEVAVQVDGLANDLAVGPGRIDAVQSTGTARPVLGEGWQLRPPPRGGDTYRVRALVVRATQEQLQRAPAPNDPRVRAYLRLSAYPSLTTNYIWPGTVVVPRLGQPPDPQVTAILDESPYGPVAALARRLAAGATSQWELVARVHRYLLDGDRFRYTTNPPHPGPFPLLDFLLRDRAGDCQHFASAAALLLRLAGVPSRVGVGFATGTRQPDGRYNVRDTDAHAWIEVYFHGIGWVAFNPTPPVAQATIPDELNPLAPTPDTIGAGRDRQDGHRGSGWLALGLVLAALIVAGVWTIGRRARRGPVPLGPLLEGVVRRSGGYLQPASTLAELGAELARLVGPTTAALAIQTERVRFAPDPPMPTEHPRIQLARALATDLGPRRALLVLIGPGATRHTLQLPHDRSKLTVVCLLLS